MKRSLLTFACFLIFTAGAARNPPMVLGPNEPVGVARGIFPGRVAWAHAPGAAAWDGRTGDWFSDDCNDQRAADWLVATALTDLTGRKTPTAAWKALFSHFNDRRGKGSAGYRKGERIAIKINQNNTYSHRNSSEINASPQLVLSLLRSLVGAGVPQPMITVFDASRFITDAVYDRCHAEFPDVVYMDHEGGEGRAKVSYTKERIPYSVDNGNLARGVADCVLDADYLINMALLKGHVGQGVTLCGKNWYGVTDIDKDWRNNAHNHFNQNREGRMQYMTFVDFMGHSQIGEKTLLFLVDGLYGSKLVGGAPGPRWQMPPFGGAWPCSLFASQDGVAIDAVCLDFLISEFPTMSDTPYADMYLVEAALADNPRSGTFYDPERDGTRLRSLGVMEHWNDPRNKQYGRNLGRKNGIELIRSTRE